MKTWIEGNKLRIRFKGALSLADEDVFRFHGDIRPFLEEIKGEGWKYSIDDVVGEALVEVNLSERPFTLNYYPPRLERFEEGKYVIETSLGDKPPALIRVLKVEGFKVGISTEHNWRAVTIDPFEKKITYITDVLWNLKLSRGKEAEKLSEAKEVYDVVKWLIKKGFKLEDEYVVERYKELIDLFEKKYKFKMKLELTVDDVGRVPGWNDLKEELAKFFVERGLLMKIVRKPAFFAKKPIP